MFDWIELDNMSSCDPDNPDSRESSTVSTFSSSSSSSSPPVFRFVESDADMRPSRFASSAIPLDFHHLTTGEDPQKLIDFLNLQKLQDGADDDNDDEDD